MIEARLNHFLSADKVPHALLFVGSREQALSLASNFSKKLVGTEQNIHPDIHHVMPEGKTNMHSLSSIRVFLDNVMLAPYSGAKKCFIIHDAERMLPTSANALLKIVEEPPAKTHFFFLTNHKEKILPTILSRTQTLYLSETSNKGERTALQEAFMALLFEGSDVDTVVKMLESGKKEREKELFEGIASETTPLQRETYEKEIEATIAMRYQEEFTSLLEIVMDWHRDLCILELGLPTSYLRFPQSVKRNKYPSWQLVDRALKEAKDALERNINTKTILEALLFRLGF